MDLCARTVPSGICGKRLDSGEYFGGAGRPLYGAGNVEVASSPRPYGSEPYVITFTTTGQNRRMGPSSHIAGTYRRAQAKLRMVQQGAPDGELYVTAENLVDANVNGGVIPVQISDVLPAG